LVEDTLPGLSEFLYLYKFQEKPPQAKLQAIFRKISCIQIIPQRPEYPASFAAYITWKTRTPMSTSEKNAALAKVANGASIVSAGNAKARIGKAVVHVRFCSRNLSAPGKFKFNINPNTLSADYELWVCGSAARYYHSA